MIFRKTFTLKGDTAGAEAIIAADSKYWLYVNGALEVREGGLKRGPNPNDTYADRVRLHHLRPGTANTVAVLVWYFGKNGFSHRSSGYGGLYFDLTTAAGEKVESDDSWRAKLHPAYYVPAGDVPNYRLSESNVGYDARLAIGTSPYVVGYNDSSWPTARALTLSQAGWGKLVERPIPQWRDYGVKQFTSQKRSGNVITCSLPYNCQFTPVIRVRSANGGETIDVRTDCYHTGGSGGEVNVHAEYITCKGYQSYESVGWMNGHEAIFTIPEDVQVVSLGYRESGYDCDFAGSFECSDTFLNSLWQKSARTLYITMRDTYMDCPDRERAQWIGDVSNELVESFYALSPEASLLTRKCAREMAGWQRSDSVMYAPVPAGGWSGELPQQSLAFEGVGVWNYYMGTGDTATVASCFPALKRYIHKWKIQNDGLPEYRSGGWDWGDWGSNVDMKALSAEWYSATLKNYAKQAALIGELEEMAWATKVASRLDSTFRAKYWRGLYYRHDDFDGKPDDRAQAMAIISDIATREQYPLIRQILRRNTYASPYMERYVLEALCRMGYTQEAITRMRKRYKPMVESNLTTLWEFFTQAGGSYNHAWSGGPLIILSGYVAGIKPMAPAFREFQVRPELCDLSSARATVPTIFGSINMSVADTSGTYHMRLSVPQSTTAHVLLPRSYTAYSVNGVVEHLQVCENDTSRLALSLGEGEYDISSFSDEPSAIEQPKTWPAENVDVYSTEGVLLLRGVRATEISRRLPRGVYIVGGRKVALGLRENGISF